MIHGRAIGFHDLAPITHQNPINFYLFTWWQLDYNEEQSKSKIKYFSAQGHVWGKILQNTGPGLLWGDKKAFIFESGGLCSWSVKWINKEGTITCPICQDQELEQWVITLEPAKSYSPTPDQPVNGVDVCSRLVKPRTMHASIAGI